MNNLLAKLEMLEKKRRDNLYYKDDYSSTYTQYKSLKLGFDLEIEIDKLENLIRSYNNFAGNPSDWKGNMITINICNECKISDTCKVWNDWINRPARKRFDNCGDVIEYDNTGNRKYQIENLKTGEAV